MTTLQERIQRLEDLEAIRQLKAFYAMCADAKYTDDHRRRPRAELDRVAREQASVFTDDAVWDGGPQFGRYEGREAIYENLRTGPWSFAVHYFLAPHLVVDGDRAHGHWLLWQPATLADGEVAVLLSAFTDDTYVRTGDGWKIAHMQFTLRFMTPPDTPWSDRRNAPFGA